MKRQMRQSQWYSLSGAADYLDVSNDTIGRRATPWRNEPVPFRVRYKFLALDEDPTKRQERRYLVDDLEALMAAN